MKINKINIGNFGKFQNFSYDFTNDFQIIFGNNEDGKTTIMNFIKLMFYGIEAQSTAQDLNKKPREKYRPWNNATMSGSIEFEFNQTEYFLQRTFGETAARDQTELKNLQTMKNIEIKRNQDVGKFLFDLDLDAFKRSVYIGSAGLIEAPANDEVAEKLIKNLAETGDQSTSGSQVIINLENAKYKLVSKSTRTGDLVNATNSLEQLHQERQEADQIVIQQENLTKRLSDLEQLEKEHKTISKKIKAQQLTKEKESLSQLKQRSISLETLKQDIEQNSVTLSNAKDLISNAQAKLEKIDNIQNNINFAKDSLPDGISKVTDLQYNKSKKIVEIEKANDQLLSTCSSLANSKKNLESMDEQVEFKKNQIFSKFQIISSSKTKSNIAFMLSFAMLVVSVIGFFVKQPILIGVGIVVLIALIIAGFIIRRNAKVDTEQLDNDLNILIKQRDNQTTDFQLQVNDFISQIESLNSLLSQYDGLNHLLINIPQQSNNFEFDNIFDNLKNIEIKSNSQKTMLLENLQMDSIDQIIENYSKYQVYSDSINNIENLEKQLINLKQEFSTIMESYKNTHSFDKSISLYNQLNSAYKQYNSQKEELELMAKQKEISDYSIDNLNSIISTLEDSSPDVEKLSVQEYGELNARAQELTQMNLAEQIRDIASKLYHPSQSIEQINIEINDLSEKVEDMQLYYDSLSLALQLMENAQQEMRKSFGPILNDRTSEIFSQLTGGKYSQVKIDKSYDIQFKSDTHYRQAKYLSAGTYDQVYLALRLAIAELISKETQSIPIMLDDVIAKYDDTRAKKALSFLSNYSKETGTQLMLFTCQNRMVDYAKELGIHTDSII